MTDIPGSAPPARARGREVISLVALVVVGAVLAIAPALAAALSLCGISGCSGGGYGRTTDPGTTLALLVATGVVAGLPTGIYAVVRRSLPLLAVALLVGVVAGVGAGVVIGSDVRGCPRNVDHETCLEDRSSVGTGRTPTHLEDRFVASR